MNADPSKHALFATHGVFLFAVWLMMSVSSIVFVEPAPFDLIAVALMTAMFATGLRVPVGLGFAALLMSIFILTNVVSIIFASPSTVQPLPYMVFYAGLTVYLILLWVFLTSLIATDPVRVLRVMWSGYTVAGVIAVTLALAGYFRLVPFYETLMMLGRAKAAFKDANVYGPFLIPVALYWLADMKGRTPAGATWRLVLFLYFAIGILIAFSRGAWGNIAVSALVVAVLLWLNARTLREYVGLAMAASAVVMVTGVLIVAAISTPQIGEMFARRASLIQSYDVEAGGRFSTQRAAIRQIARNPVGLGPNRTDSEFGRVPHNVYLKITAENGWLGGLVFVAFLVLTLWRGFWFALSPTPMRNEFIVAYASTVGIVAESVIIDTMHWRHLFVLLAMIWGPMLAYGPRRSAAVPLQNAP